MTKRAQDRRVSIPSALEVTFAKIGILLSSGAFVTGFTSDRDTSDTGHPVLQLAWAGIAALSVIFLYMDRRRAKECLSDWYPWAFISLPALSILWSIDPMVTIKRTLALTGTVAFGVFFGSRFPLRQQLQIVSWSLCFAAFASIVVVLVFPDVGIMHEIGVEGTWRGVFPHKNGMGQMMVINCLALYLGDSARGRSWQVYGMLLISIVLIVLSGSKSSLLLLVIASFTLYVVLGGAKRLRRWVMLSATISLFAALSSIELANVLGYIGRDATLTGRTSLWGGVLLMIARHPMLGYGYGTFWMDGNPDRDLVWKIAGWHAAHSHNGFLEVLLGCGIVGLIAVLCLMGLLVKRSVSFYRTSANTLITVFPFLFLLEMIVSNLDEANLVAYNSLYSVLMFSVAASMHLYMKSTARAARIRRFRGVPLSGAQGAQQ